VIHSDDEDPVAAIRDLTMGIGVDRAIDAVGVDANSAHHGPAAKAASTGASAKDRAEEVRKVAPSAKPEGENWHPGDAPSQALEWAVDALAKAGTLAVIGVYGATSRRFPIGKAMQKNLTIKMGNCNHRHYVPKLVEMVRTGAIDPTAILTQKTALVSAIDAYKAFDRRTDGWTKVALTPPRANGEAKAASPGE
jgi:threonine dehydrogenase-like Zn-dependent dehydrogenase